MGPLVVFRKDVEPVLLFDAGAEFNHGMGIDWAYMLDEGRGWLISLQSIAVMLTSLRHSVTRMCLSSRLKKWETISHACINAIPTDISLYASISSATFFTPTKPGSKKRHSTPLAQGSSEVPNSRILQRYRYAHEQRDLPTTGEQIFKSSTVSEMFRNQILDKADVGRKAIQPAMYELTNPIPELYLRSRKSRSWAGS
ncbi:hypothetical protein WAI453_001292 [Rhynchosporium graminicola]